MDLLADVLSTVHFKGTVYCQAQFGAPWGVQWDGRPNRAGFFMVLRGACYIEFVGQKEPVLLAPGDFIMSPRALGYTLRDSLTSQLTKFDRVLGALGIDELSTHKVVEFGGAGPATKLIMGCFDLDLQTSNPFLASLPEYIYVKSEELQGEPWMETTLRFLSAECAEGKLGSSLTVGRLTELIFIQAMRIFLKRADGGGNRQGWLVAAGHPQIGKALACMHESPQTSWTVASLAESADMSRSAFAAKFKELLKVPPLDYLTTWRMHKAEALLAQQGHSLASIADAVGYSSEAAFCKAFKRQTGCAPGRWRQRAQATV